MATLVPGRYMCACCSVLVVREMFLITPGNDAATIVGECWDCHCREFAAAETGAAVAEEELEALKGNRKLLYHYKKLCQKRHATRTDTDMRGGSRARTGHYEAVLREAMDTHNISRAAARKRVARCLKRPASAAGGESVRCLGTQWDCPQ